MSEQNRLGMIPCDSPETSWIFRLTPRGLNLGNAGFIEVNIYIKEEDAVVVLNSIWTAKMNSTTGIDDFRGHPQICDNVDLTVDEDKKVANNEQDDPFGGEEYGEVQYRTMKWWCGQPSPFNLADTETHPGTVQSVCHTASYDISLTYSSNGCAGHLARRPLTSILHGSLWIRPVSPS